ncbi:MAG: SDR family oxidoreductase [Salibacteraceae bacterium]
MANEASTTKILITGANGMLGQKLVYAGLQDPNLDIIATGRCPNRLVQTQGYTYLEMSITDSERVHAVFQEHRPDVVINCAAITQVDYAEENPSECWRVNVDAVKILLKATAAVSGKFIQVSTDFVFDGTQEPYRETSVVNPVNYYGKSKAEAEKLVRKSGLAFGIVRTILVYGVTDHLSRSNAVLWAIRSLREGKAIRVVEDQFRTPTLVEDLAAGILAIVRRNKKGTFHIAGKDRMSIHQLVIAVSEAFGLTNDAVTPVATASLNEPARRPPCTSFDLSKAKEHLDFEPRSFSEGLQLVAQQLEKITAQP